MATSSQRRTYFVDPEVQGTLLRKAAWYWLLSLLVVGSLNVLGWIFVAPGVNVLVQIRELLPSFFGILGIAMVSSLIVLPILLYDLTKLTNRFAGPILRLQRSLDALAEGKSIPPLSFREGDYWHDLAEAVNRIAARLEAAEIAAAENGEEPDSQSYETTNLEKSVATL